MVGQHFLIARRWWMGLLVLSLMAWTQPGHAQFVPTFTTLHSFNYTDGSNPNSALVQASDGNFYGTASNGGAYKEGVIYKITPTGVYKLLHSFTGANGEGLLPAGALIQARDGNLYGTTFYGGMYGAGTIFSISASGAFTTLYSFSGPDGANPASGLIQATDGNLYGTTASGGAFSGGTLFLFSGGLTTLHNFNGDDGVGPTVLLQATDGNFYGITNAGGTVRGGTVYKMATDGTFSTLYSFYDIDYSAPDGAPPVGLMQASDGNLYGTTNQGGAAGVGTVFQLTTAGAFTTIYSFNKDGLLPTDSLIQGSDGNLYGSTFERDLGLGGTVFRITTTGVLTTLHYFNALKPYGHPIQGIDGNLYGSTASVGADFGTVFKVAVPPVLKTLTFNTPVVSAGSPVLGRITLSKPAPAGGIQITLSNNSSAVSMPATVNVPPGLTFATFTMTTDPSTVAVTTATVTASFYGSSLSSALTINPVLVHSLTLSASNVTAGANVTGTVTLTSPAPAGGQVVTLSGAMGSVAYPAAITIPVGQLVKTFPITTSPTTAALTTVTVGAACNGSSQTQTLTVNPETIASVVLNASDVTAGASVTAKVTLSQPAPQSGVTLALSGQVPGINYPASLHIGGGQSFGTFILTTSSAVITTTTAVSVTASLNGASQSAPLAVEPALRFGFTVRPATVQGGNTSTAMVTLASPLAAMQGVTFVLTSNNPGVVSFSPAAIMIASGQTTGTATINTTGVAANTVVMVTVTIGSTSKTLPLTVTP